MIIDLSPMMLARVKNYTHKLNRKLLSECAYYPRMGCQNCDWQSPNPDCKWSHILTDTRCDGGAPPAMRKKVSKGSGTIWGVSVDKMIARLPPFARKEVEEILSRLEVK